MFTVILTSERSQGLLERWRELFIPYEERGRIAFCTWNPGAAPRTIEEAVPTLAQAIKGKREWRALVVGTGMEGVLPDRVSPDENPFDFDDIHRVDEGPLPAPSPYPLVRLSHMLLGYPEMGPKGFEADPSFHDAETDRRVFRSEFLAAGGADEEAETEFKARLLLGYHPRIHYRVIPHGDEEVRAHEDLVRLYELRQSAPTELVLVASRRLGDRSPTDALRQAWDSAHAREASRFVERNYYPASTRFLAFDMRPPSHAEFDLEEMRFALSVLTVAVNDLPPSGLQAERLYRLDVTLDHARLADDLNSHLGRLVDMREYIDGRLRVRESRVGAAPPDLLPTISVTVDFDRIKGDQLRAPHGGYGLAVDRPRESGEKWREASGHLRLEAARFIRQPSRALQQAVAEARAKDLTEVQPEATLSEIDILELQEELARRSDGLVRAATSDIADGRRLERLLDEHDATISRAISERMRSGTIATALCVVFSAWALALLPFVISSLFDGASNLLESLLLTLVIVAVVAASSVLTLEVMRRQFLGLIRACNKDLRDFVASVTRGAQQYGEFLTELVTYASGRQRLTAERRRLERSTLDRVRLRRLLVRIEARIDAEKSIVRSIDRPVHIEQGSKVASDVEKHGLARVEEVLLWSPGRTLCQFNNSGDTISAPYAFVSALQVTDQLVGEPRRGGREATTSQESADHARP